MDSVPLHIGYILDGNRRWAKSAGLASIKGHAKGQEVLREVLHATFEKGVKYVSIYAFSTENWQRDTMEVNYLMKGVVSALEAYTDEFMEKGVRIRLLGERDGLSEAVQKSIEIAETTTAHNTAATLGICLNYGGHQEIASAVKQIVHSGAQESDITPELIAKNLYAADIPACDLIVRTSGEQRLSNFMLWRAAYSELLFIDKNWPEMTADDVEAVLKEYALRSRRFGS